MYFAGHALYHSTSAATHSAPGTCPARRVLAGVGGGVAPATILGRLHLTVTLPAAPPRPRARGGRLPPRPAPSEPRHPTSRSRTVGPISGQASMACNGVMVQGGSMS